MLGARIAPAMVGNMMNAQITVLVLEHEEVLLHGSAAQVEEVLDISRDAVRRERRQGD